MKRFFLAAVLLLVSLTVSAQKFGITGGLTLSQLENIKESRNAGFNAGVAMNFPLVLGFSLQPEFVYNVKGANLPGASDEKYSAGYGELGLQAQWGLDLIVAKPFVLVEPYVGAGLKGSIRQDGQTVKDNLWDFADRLECGIAVGGGIEILYNLQISAKGFWTVGSLFNNEGNFNPDLGSTATGQLTDLVNGAGNFVGTTVSLTYFF